ncbi:aldo/keto reductase [Antrihabitans cavernicola]|uniref:Aldo/keto reductase n=1 Tax=Antrihabitans cavernicola TaxID=2495913 RepID=A0A5A7SEH0_9NOCA|nr:aldo/keto reductase [Spelaeibacter cavernicola]KAA0022925.1 aldo/keto reductase [Spelaeibacter cavernicola]
MTDVLGDNLTTSQLGFGGMALTPVYGDADPAESLATLDHALDIGVTFIDTANVYGGGANEELISKVVAKRRSEVTLATKFGISGNPAAGERATRGDRAYVLQCVDESLGRLNTDVIDLYYLHRLDPNTPIEETVGAMAELVAAGKVRHLGLSEVTADELLRAQAIHPIAAVQSEWSIWSRDVEAKVVPTAAELGVGFVPYSPLGRGFLTGTVDATTLGKNDFRRQIPRFADGAIDTNQAAVDTVRSVADAVGATPAQVSLAWLRYKGEQFGLSVVPIPGTRRAKRIDENVASLSVVLDTAQLATLDGVAASVAGARSSDATWVSSGRE